MLSVIYNRLWLSCLAMVSKMPNPNPRQTEEFKKHWFKPVGKAPPEKLERKPVAVAVGKSIYAAIYSLDRPDRITWLRRVITEAARRELLGQATVSNPPATPAAPSNPPLDVANLVQVLTEVLSVPRLPAVARKRLEALLESLSRSNVGKGTNLVQTGRSTGESIGIQR